MDMNIDMDKNHNHNHNRNQKEKTPSTDDSEDASEVMHEPPRKDVTLTSTKMRMRNQ